MMQTSGHSGMEVLGERVYIIGVAATVVLELRVNVVDITVGLRCL